MEDLQEIDQLIEIVKNEKEVVKEKNNFDK